jgi:tripartite-type tricarboxylate transporter receptor subunit TctC
MVRLLAQGLSEKWKRSVVIENRSGGSGLVSANEARNSPADGYTLYVSNDSPAINPNVMEKLPFEHRRVFAPISLLVLIDFKLLVRPDLPVKTVQDLAALVKSKPGAFSFASAGTFTSHHLIAERFHAMAGLNAVHVPFRGAVPALNSLLAGHTDYMFTGFTGTAAFVESGQVREIATTGTRRNDATPQLPTVGETLPGFSAYAWFAMWARSEVPEEIRAQVASDVAAVMKGSEIVKRLNGIGMESVGSSPDELSQFYIREQEKWAELPLSVRRPQ